MPTPGLFDNGGNSRPNLLHNAMETVVAVVAALALAAGWFVALRYQIALTQAVTAAYQETELEIVKAVARNVTFFIEQELQHERPIEEIEQEIFHRFVAPVRLLQNGDAWIYAPDHVVYDHSSDFPEKYRGKSMTEIFAMQRENGASHYEAMSTDVTEAREGAGWYIWLPEKGPEIAAWTPVRFKSDVTEGDYVRLTVTDTGKGIPESEVGRIFEPFYTRKVLGRSGSGLGLAVVWNTVQDHRGFIHVQSAENKGTRFELYLPITRESLPAEQPRIPFEAYSGRGETILVVDDVELQRTVATDMLTLLGYRVKTAPSGEAALDFLEHHTVDLVVLDMIMDPGIDGLETYRRILARHPGQKAIVTSGYSESDRVNEIQKLGACTYLPKPYLLEKLGLAVRRELDRIPGQLKDSSA